MAGGVCACCAVFRPDKYFWHLFAGLLTGAVGPKRLQQAAQRLKEQHRLQPFLLYLAGRQCCLVFLNRL